MKIINKIILFLLVFTLFISCNRNTYNVNEQKTVNESNYNALYENDSTTTFLNEEKKTIEQENVSDTKDFSSVLYLVGKNYDLLTDYYWSVSDGRYLLKPPVPTIDWVGSMTPRIIFYKIKNLPIKYMYQERLRKEKFTLIYKTEEIDKLYIIENSFSINNILDVIFNNDYTSLGLYLGNKLYSRQNRIGLQEDFEHPLVGIWEHMVNLTEYRLIDPTGCVYYMEIDSEIPYWGVRRGTYLLKQIDNKTFETVSSFPDGNLKLVVSSNNQILLTPLFTLPDDEEGILDLLVLNRNYVKISELPDNEDFPRALLGQ